MGHNGGPAFYPEGLPDTFKGQSDRETIEKLWAGMPRAPASPDAYKLELSPDFVKKHGDLADDPAMKLARSVAHKAGLSERQLSGFVQDFYAGLEKEGLLMPRIDPEAELAKLMPREGTPEERRRSAAKRYIAVQNGLKGLVDQKWLTQVEANNLTAVAVTGEGVTALEKVFARIEQLQQGVTGGGQTGAAGSQPATEHERALRVLYPTMHKVA